MKVVQTNYGMDVDILFNLDPYTARPIMVSDEEVAAVNGKKIVKAGTPLDKAGKAANDATARYVLLKDVDVTYGPKAGTGVYRGTLNKDKIKDYAGVTLSAEAIAALKGIIFMSDKDLDY
jgi:hypothetical protein